MIENSETSPTNKYSTRKKIIDFAKLGERLSLTGSNCHFCKSVMTVQNSNACRSIEKVNNKKKSCNKKFCYDCLQKNFPIFWANRNNKDWKCPCCSDECTCVQCKKNLIKEKNIKNKINNEREINTSKVYKNWENFKNDQNINVENSDVVMERKWNHIIEENIENFNNNDKNDYYDNLTQENLFDFNKLYKSLQFSKVQVEKLSALPKPENGLIPENELLKYNNSRDDYLKTLDKYKEHLKLLNLNKLLN